MSRALVLTDEAAFTEEQAERGFHAAVRGPGIEKLVFLQKGYGDNIEYFIESYSFEKGWCWSDSTTDGLRGPWPSLPVALDDVRAWHRRLIEEAPMRAAMADVMRGAPEKKRARETTLDEIAVLLIVIIGILLLMVLR